MNYDNYNKFNWVEVKFYVSVSKKVLKDNEEKEKKKAWP